ncbi:hypothetical protein FRC06_005098 [Ceratobasidium sp. 370]|nr:hypothetical protein FRC06_005098 [Ceratobasidium sp. 370]
MSYSPLPNITTFNTSPRPVDEIKIYDPQLNPSLSQHSKEDIELTPVGAPPVPHAYYSESHKSSAAHLARIHEAKQATTRGKIKRIIRNIWLTTWLPVIAFMYLAFCYVAATRVVRVSIYNIDTPADHLYGIKAGVTTLSIIVIGIALLPVKSLLDDLKGEEFFRRLRKARVGVPLDYINDVSTPAHALSKGFFSILRFQASKYYAGAILSSFVAAAISSLAPAALSVGIIPVDNEITAFRVGAVARDSIYISSMGSPFENPDFTSKATEAASMGIDMTFKPTSLKYAVPVPLDLTPKDRARWITDVIIMDPMCSWTVSDPPMAPPAGSDANNTFLAKVNLTLPNYGVGSSFYLSQLQPSYNKIASVFSSDLDGIGSGLYNLTTNDPPTQGIMAWLVAQCTSCAPEMGADPARIDFTGIPTQQFSSPKLVGTNTTTVTLDVGILVCDPRASIETREVRMDGSGGIEVVEDGRTFVPQGNLQISQTRLLLAKALQAYSSSSGPTTGFRGIGKSAQVRLLFGQTGNATETTTLKPLPIDQLARGYNLAIQAAMRAYLSGSMATAYNALGVQADKTWAVLPIRQPPVINDTALFLPNTDGSLGTPPQNITMLVDIGSQPLFALTPDCLFCPSDGMYDPSYSSSAKIAASQVSYGDLSLGGTRGNETVTLGGVLQDVNSPLGHLGMFVPQNQTRRTQSLFARLNDQGQLLNPVWGLRLGGDKPQLTIGALDPNDYEGEINWVPALGDQPIIHVDALKGYQGNVVPANYPINATLDTLSKNIYLPELDVFMMNQSLVGPQGTINIYPPRNETFGVQCNGTKFPTVDFSVEINGEY